MDSHTKGAVVPHLFHVPTSLTHALDLTQRKVPVLLGFRVPPTAGMPGLRLPRAKRNETKHVVHIKCVAGRPMRQGAFWPSQ